MDDLEFGGALGGDYTPPPQEPTAPMEPAPTTTPDTEKKPEEKKPDEQKPFDWRAALKSVPTISYGGAMPASATEDLASLNSSNPMRGDALRSSLEKQYGSYGSIFYNVIRGMNSGG